MELKKGCKDLVAEANASIRTIPTSDAIARHGDDNIVFVDLRDVRELKREGMIPGAIHAPRGMIEFWVDPESPYFKEVFGQSDKRYLFHCASGWRSALTVATLQDMGFDAAHLREGFSTWEQHGGPVEHDMKNEVSK